MPYRTLAHGQVGTAELKLWVVTRFQLGSPRTFITDRWNNSVYRSANPPNTFTKVRAQPDSFELNEPTDEAMGEFGQALYNTGHGFYSYEWDAETNKWVLEERLPPEEAPSPPRT